MSQIKSRTVEFLRLTRNVKNPFFKKRATYGHEKVEQFKYGTGFVLLTIVRDDDEPGGGLPERSIYTSLDGWWSIDRPDLVALLRGSADESTPRTAAEAILFVTEGGGYAWLLPEVLERLVKDGKVTPDDVAEAAKAELAEPQ